MDRWLHLAGETVLRPIALYDAKYGGQFEYSRYDWVLERALMRRMRNSRGALFHVLYGEKNFRHSWRLTSANRNRLIATLHHPLESYGRLFRSTGHLSYLSHAIVMSENLRAPAEAFVGASRVSVIPYGVDVDYFCPQPEREGRELQRVVFVGQHLRDFDTLRRVVEKMLRGSKTVEFVLVCGDPRCQSVTQLDPSRVRRLVGLSDEDYRDVLQTSSLMLLPLTASAAVTAALEAIACGVPVLTTEGGVSDYVLPGAGMVFRRGDADSLAQAALALLADAEGLDSLGASARQRALAFAWPLVAQRTAEVYRAVMAA